MCIDVLVGGECVVYGVGLFGLCVVVGVFDCGNVGIGMCLFIGLLVG